MKMRKSILIIAVMGSLLAGCDNSKEPVYTQSPVVQQEQQPVVYGDAPQQPQVVVVEQQPQVVYRDSSNGITAGHVAAAGLGYLAGKHMSSSRRSYGSSKTIVNNHYYSTPKKRSYFGSRSRGRRR